MAFVPRRVITLLAAVGFILFLVFFRNLNSRESWRGIPEAVGLGEVIPDARKPVRPGQPPSGSQELSEEEADNRPNFHAGVPKPPGSEYSRMLVVPRMHDEEVDWISHELPDLPSTVYVADDPEAEFHPPKNKGHEVMIYLTYIIDHYDDLPDVMMFMHSHRWSWHNDDILDYDAVEMIKRLSSERVTREGYMNMRCHWDPGCPDWMHPGNLEEDMYKQEESLIAKAWSELFPLDPVPQVLAQPCCAQFALSKERVLSIPKSRFVFYRTWLLRTPLSDYISGRVWEYMWQYIFTGQNVHCPVMHSCYCDGYGVCFGGEEQFNSWFETRYNMRELESKLREWEENTKKIEEATMDDRLDEVKDIERPEPGKNDELRAQIDVYKQNLEDRKQDALRRGEDAHWRAIESNRTWTPGDGF